MRIVITDQENGNLAKEESFLGNQYTVISRSGLNITEIQLIEAVRGFSWKTGQGYAALLQRICTRKRRLPSIALISTMPTRLRGIWKEMKRLR